MKKKSTILPTKSLHLLGEHDTPINRQNRQLHSDVEVCNTQKQKLLPYIEMVSMTHFT